METRLDEQEVGFHRQVRDAYHHLASDEPKRVRLIDGGRNEDLVAEDVWQAVQGLLKGLLVK